MGMPALGILSLVIATAFLIWVCEKQGNPMQGFGKVVAWIAIVLSGLILIGQLYTCGSMCMKGQCSRMMKGQGMGMMGGGMGQGMGGMHGPMMNMPQPPPPPEKGK